MDGNLLIVILEQLGRRQEARIRNRNLRDGSNPFELPEETFRKMYRLSRDAAMDFFQDLLPFMQLAQRTTSIPNVVKFVATLHFFAHGSYQKSIGVDHYCGLSQPSVSRCMHEVVNIITEQFVQQYVQFPTTVQNITNAKMGFFNKYQFPGVIGCIDCTHIAITPPPLNHPDYPGNLFINRKGYHSINCQLICDSDLRITHVNARYPGSVHDAAIWMISNVNQFLRQNYGNDRTTWLLGDSGYPLQPYLLTPIVGAVPGTPEARYTQMHKTTRNTIERCIGVLKAYFRCLRKDRVLHFKPPTAAKIIYSCVVLHNILRRRDIHDLDVEAADAEDNEDDNHDFVPNEEPLNEGRNVRGRLIQMHFNF